MVHFGAVQNNVLTGGFDSGEATASYDTTLISTISLDKLLHFPGLFAGTKATKISRLFFREAPTMERCPPGAIIRFSKILGRSARNRKRRPPKN
jgi:hypothetical protein